MDVQEQWMLNYNRTVKGRFRSAIEYIMHKIIMWVAVITIVPVALNFLVMYLNDWYDAPDSPHLITPKPVAKPAWSTTSLNTISDNIRLGQFAAAAENYMIAVVDHGESKTEHDWNVYRAIQRYSEYWRVTGANTMKVELLRFEMYFKETTYKRPF